MGWLWADLPRVSQRGRQSGSEVAVVDIVVKELGDQGVLKGQSIPAYSDGRGWSLR